MTIHTPGPWKLKKDDELGLIYILGPEGNQIGTFLEWPTSPEETRANAHLAAAAPELLELCERSLKFLLNILKDAPSGNPPEEYPIVIRLREVIARVKGEEVYEPARQTD